MPSMWNEFYGNQGSSFSYPKLPESRGGVVGGKEKERGKGKNKKEKKDPFASADNCTH